MQRIVKGFPQEGGLVTLGGEHGFIGPKNEELPKVPVMEVPPRVKMSGPLTSSPCIPRMGAADIRRALGASS